MKVTLIGCGYVGLVTGSCLAEVDHTVVCTDQDVGKIEMLQRDQVPFYEPHLDELVVRGRRSGRLSFTADAPEAIRSGDVIFICVNTPPLETGDADLTAVDNVARMIAAEARSSKLVVEKSTVPVRTGQQLRRALTVYNRSAQVKFSVASNPEFLREGTAVHDFLHPDRIVVGVDDAEAEKTLRQLYQPLRERQFDCPVHSHCPAQEPSPFVVTSIESAELIKHASNSFLALKISYINAIADLCERVGANVGEVAYAMGLDPRIGLEYLRAGLGFGGFCLPKDIQAFIRLAEQAGVDFALLKEAERINKARVAVFLQKAKESLWVLKDKCVAVLGLAFKADTDDIRFSQAIEVVRQLLSEGARVQVYDPQAMAKARVLLPDISYGTDAYQAAKGADALAITTEWEEFRRLDWKRIFDLMRRPVVLDGRNLLDPQAMRELGFEYHSFGRPGMEQAAMGPANGA
jgi:UDPglucose 6-dehydrogenase